MAQSYDNDEYVRYVRDDEYFLNLFNGLALEQLAALDLEDEQVEGVSGATMTSMAVAEGLVLAAQQHRQMLENSSQPTNSRYPWSIRTLGTTVVVFVGVTIGLSRLRADVRQVGHVQERVGRRLEPHEIRLCHGVPPPFGVVGRELPEAPPTLLCSAVGEAGGPLIAVVRNGYET